MNNLLPVVINEDNTRVMIREISPGCTAGMVYEALEREDVTTGILHDAIAEAIDNADRRNETIRDVCVAATATDLYTVQYGRTGKILSGEEITVMREELTAVGKAISQRDYATRLHNGVFVRSGDVILTVRAKDSFVNVFGVKVTIGNKPALLEKERCIAIKTTPDGYQFVALMTGYLVINTRGFFDIVDPFLASDDKLILYVHVAPMIHGYDAFIDKVVKSAPPASASMTVTHFGSLNAVEMKDHLYRLELRSGKEPVPGRPGSIRFHVKPDEIPKRRNDPKINYKDISCFREILPGTLLAERIPMRQSVSGVNVFGETIDAPRVKDIIFSCGNGVTEEYTPDLIRYVAKEHGILEINDNYLNVVPELVIHGDVDNETGNIKYSRSVTITGIIKSGFKVECGDLTVRDSIEDAAEIICSGDLFVSKGILGERTRVVVAGNAKAGIVQGADVRVQGDFTIEEFAYHSKIFCGKKLVINGKGITTREKGCVIGGIISCLDTMELHSAGSVATLTTLCCGFDPEGYAILMDTINLEKTLKKKIMQLQNSLHFNSSNKAAMIQRVQLFSPEKREAIKRTLQELRQTIAQVEKAEASVALLSRKVFPPDILQSHIRIYNHIVAPTLIEFPKLKRKIYRESFGVKFAIVDGEITMYENLTNQNS